VTPYVLLEINRGAPHFCSLSFALNVKVFCSFVILSNFHHDCKRTWFRRGCFSDRSTVSDTPVFTVCSFYVPYATLQSPCSCPWIVNSVISVSVCKLHGSRAKSAVPWCDEEFWRRWIGLWSCDTVRCGRQIPVFFISVVQVMWRWTARG
jgi:hypothetical protein